MSGGENISARIAEAYRWHRRLGLRLIETPHCHIVVDPDRPDVWDRNHVDDVRAETAQEIDAVLVAMELHLAHTDWRVVLTDASTPDAFLARLAFENFEERPLTIQMALEGSVAVKRRALDPVDSEADWTALAGLARMNFAEGRASLADDIPPEVADGLLYGYRGRAPACRFYLAREGGQAVAYAAMAAAPNGVGMIEDVFTAPSHRGRGVASAMIATLAERLRAEGSGVVFIGALGHETAKQLYSRLGFRPVALERTWVKETIRSAAP